MNYKQQKLQNLNELRFHELLLTLLPRMDAKNVDHTHGPNEHGKDIVFYKEDKFGKTYCAVVAKVGDISGASSGSETLKTLLRTIEYQVESAFKVAYIDVAMEHSETVNVNEVIVWTTGSISNTAEERILASLKSEYRNVRFRDGKQTLELIQRYLPSYFEIDDTNIADYFDKAKAKYNSIEELYSLVTSETSSAPPSIFVPPELEVVSSNRLRDRGQRETHKTKTFKQLITMKSNTAILGDMGSGKSTLLRRILMTTIIKNQNDMSKYPIPVLLKFTELKLNRAQPLNANREQVVESAIMTELNTTCGRDLYTDITNDLTNGNFIVLIDGLDELDGNESIEIAMGIAKGFAQRYPKCRVIIASRLELINQTKLFVGFKLYKLEEFTIKQVRQLVVGWFGKNTPASRKLIQIISNPITIFSIPHTPLALNIMALLFQNGYQDIPSNLTELLRKYMDLALGRWDRSKNVRNQIEWTFKERILQKTKLGNAVRREF